MTGSQPLLALKPSVPQPGFLPVVISVNASGLSYYECFVRGPCPEEPTNSAQGQLDTYQYRVCNPTVDLFVMSRSSLISVNIAAQMGTAIDVPAHPVRPAGVHDDQVVPHGRNIGIPPSLAC